MMIEEMPREKLIRLGAEKLKDEELLAIILNTGSKGKGVVELSTFILEKLYDISYFKEIELEELMQINGIKEAKATRILACIELSKRINNHVTSLVLNCPEAIYQNLKEYANEKQEHFILLSVNSKCQLISKKVIFIGTTNSVNVYPKDILKEAIKRSAIGVIIAHNHPSGDYMPSKSDFQTTKELQGCLELVGIKLYDHIVFSEKGYYSMSDHNKI